MQKAKVGVIGGSGLYEIEGLADVERHTMRTPWGAPSDDLMVGTLNGVRVAFLPRHGEGHVISPSELPARANIWALKSLGVTHVISVSAVGSLRKDIAPRHIVLPDQLLDRTKGVRPVSFFGNGVVVHIAFDEPYCPQLRSILGDSAQEAGGTVHNDGTMIVMEGPQFSTKAESFFYRQIGGDIIGMTALPEAKLAREAELCYATLAMVTDYDCWHEEEEAVSVEMVVRNLQANVALAKEIVALAVARIAQADRICDCGHALEGAILTDPEAIPAHKREQLRPLIGRFLESA